MEVSGQLQVSAALAEKQNLCTYWEPNCDPSVVQAIQNIHYTELSRVQSEYTVWRQSDTDIDISQVNLLKTKRHLLYIRNQSVPRCKRFPPRL